MEFSCPKFKKRFMFQEQLPNPQKPKSTLLLQEKL